MAAKCRGVSPLWFLFMWAGLLWRSNGGFVPVAGELLGLSSGSFMDLLGAVECLEPFAEFGGVGSAAALPGADLFLRPGDSLGRFGVVWGPPSCSSSLALLGVVPGEVQEGFWMLATGSGSCSQTGCMFWACDFCSSLGGSVSFTPSNFRVLFCGLRTSTWTFWGSGWLPRHWKDTLLLVFPSVSPKLISTSSKTLSSTAPSLLNPHCWFAVSSLIFLRFFLVWHLVGGLGMLLAFLPKDLLLLFFLFFFFPSFPPSLWGEEEPESWEEELKLKMDRLRSWSLDAASDEPAGDFSVCKFTSTGFSTRQRTLRLFGLNQILKFLLCLRTDLSFKGVEDSAGGLSKKYRQILGVTSM